MPSSSMTRYMPNASTTTCTTRVAVSNKITTDAAMTQKRLGVVRAVAAAGICSKLKIDELRNFRHQHECDGKQAADGHRPAGRRLPPDCGWLMRFLRDVSAMRTDVACQLLRVGREPGNCEKCQ